MNSLQINPAVRLACRLYLGIKKVFLRKRIQNPRLERVRGRYFLVVPEVLNPVVFRSGQYFADVLSGAGIARPLPENPAPIALDMGTGCGICAVFTADLGYRVVGVDINPFAVRCAKANILLNNLEDAVEIRQGDLFAPVSGRTFDLVLFNPPFYRAIPVNEFDLAWKNVDVFERFASGLDHILSRNGKALVLLSTDGDGDAMLMALDRNQWSVTAVHEKYFGNEIMRIYEVRRPGNQIDG